MKTKNVLVVCGTGVATSTLVASAIEEAMRARGISVVLRQCKVAEMRSMLAGVNLIVSTTPVPDNLDRPVIKGLPFLTGIGKDAVLDQIEAVLRKD